MRHIDVEQWSRRGSALHRWDARLKVLTAVLLIGAISATSNHRLSVITAYAVILLTGIAVSRLPAFAIAGRAALVLPFSGVFAGFAWLSGDMQRAISIPLKSYFSCLAAVLLISTTTLPAVLRALGSFRVPRAVLVVTQFVYRYVFVLFEQASAMRRAANCRGGSLARNRSLFRAAAGTLAVLFGKSYDRAEGIHNAMISRGFNGSIAVIQRPALHAGDVVAFAILAVVIALSWMML